MSLMLFLATAGTANADLATLTWNDSVGVGGDLFGGILTEGDPITVTVSLDNGGSTLSNQTWTTADFVGISFNANNGQVVVTGAIPTFGGSAGSFQTSAAGTVISAPTDWNAAGSSVTNNLGGTTGEWFLNGFNPIAFEFAPQSRSFGAQGDTTVASNWSASIVPEPTAFALLALAGGLVCTRRRKA